ncbi:RagB/SusD family nutrient uptake outer membrane protein [Flavihumibacter sp. R14]|nr:RagB/SusD family nutrient uptake outer membrane protein [Flavihumibacter soli]
MMKNKLSILILAITLATALYACKRDFLDIKPQGALDEATLSSEKGVNRVLLGAYAMLDGHDGGLNLGGEWGSSGSNFLFGSIGGAEANKGSDPTDQAPNMTPVQRHEASATLAALNDRWKALYEGVKRTNTTLQLLEKVELSADAQKNITGQARFLRAWYHFQLRITYGKVPYLDEKIDADLASGAIEGVSNETDIYPLILGDAKFAYENLPALQDAVGRANKWAAGALYGKILMFTKDYATAKTVLNDVVTNGTNPLGVKYGLNANFDDNFNVDFDNSKESVLAFQSSAQDNAGARNGNWGDALNTPASEGGGGFFTPTYYFANHFKTNAAGLPVSNPQNNEVYDPYGQAGFTQYSGNIDPRLDWTIGREGVPFHDWGTYSNSWVRDKSAGPYASKKGMIRESQVGAAHDASIWFSSGGVSLNMNLIRFSDVMLLLAEAEVEAGSITNALGLINQIRNRAANGRKVPSTAGVVPFVQPYTAFASQAEARTAVRLERTLELGMEGHRFFDLVRWGIATTEMNAYYNYEKVFPYQVLLKQPTPASYGGAAKDYYPVPQEQIDLSKGFIKP